MSNNSIKSGLIWNSIQQFGQLGFSLISILVLSRLLSPTDYGIFAVLGIFIQIANMLVDSGIGGYVIKKQDAGPIYFSTLFVYNLAVSIILYVIIYVCAPWIAELYDAPVVSPALRIIGLNVIIQAFSIVQFSYLYKELKFKQLAIATLISGFVGLLSALWMALKGWGIWALIYQQVIISGLTTLLYFAYNRTFPKLKFNFAVFKEQFSFGVNLLGSLVLDTIRNNITNNFIGKVFSLKTAGYFVQGQHMQSYPANMALNVINRTFFPILSKLNESIDEFKAMASAIRRKMYAYLFPCFALLIIYAEDIVRIMLGDKWIPSVPFFKILLIGVFPQIIVTVNRTILKALGYTRDILILDVIAFVLLIGLLCGAMFVDYIYLMPIAIVFTQFVALGISFYFQKKRVGYSYSEQLAEILVISPVIVVPILVSMFLCQSLWLRLTLPIVTMLAIVGIYISRRNNEYYSLFETLKAKLSRKQAS